MTSTTTRATGKPNGTKSKKQVQAIWVLARGRGMTDEELHSLVAAETGNESIRALSRANADKVIIALGGTAFNTKRKTRRTRQDHHQQTNTKQIAAGSQLDLMRSLANRRDWTEDSLKKFCQRMIKRDHPATTTQANTIIEALKSMNRRDGLVG